MTASSAMPPAAPFFSLAVACCDIEPYLGQCLDSILSQPFPDWECILWVEESRDATLDIARAFGARDSRFRVFSGPRTGSCSVSRNKGIELARGEYLLFLDGDDTLAPGALRRIRDRIAARPGADLYPGSLVLRHDEPGHDDFVRRHMGGRPRRSRRRFHRPPPQGPRRRHRRRRPLRRPPPPHPPGRIRLLPQEILSPCRRNGADFSAPSAGWKSDVDCPGGPW